MNSHSQTYRLKLLLGHTKDIKNKHPPPPKPYAFRFHGNSECLPPGYCFAVYLSVLLYKQQIPISLFLQHKCMRLVTAGANRISLNPVRQVNDITSQV